MDTNNITEVSLQSLTKKSWIALAWALLWRGLITAIGSGVAGGIVGGIIGFIIGMFSHLIGIDVEAIRPIIQIISGFLGIIIGFLFTILLIKWLFRARFSGFRLALVSNSENVS